MKISEIAALAGVSPAAVSRCLNGGSISEEKKLRIKKVIDETGYAPNPAARSLRQQRSDSIGLIVPKADSDSIGKLIEGVTSELGKAGYTAVFGNAGNDPDREAELLRTMQDSNLAGAILMGTVFTPEHIRFFKESAMPVVVCGQNHPSVTCIYHDDLGAAREIARYMISKGRKKLAYIGAVEKDECVGAARRIGVEEAMIEACISPASLVREQVMFTADDGCTGMRSILDSGFTPDGVICATDTLAVGAMTVLRERGFSIPDDISVAGIGGGELGASITPALTTARLYYRECGEKAAEQLIRMIHYLREHPDSELPVTHTMLGYTLSERESV